MRTLTLLGPLAGILLLVGLFEENVPTQSSDHTIAAWLAAAGNGSWLAHAAAEVVAGLLLLAYAHVLRHRLAGEDAALGRLVTSLGTMLGTLVVIGGALFGAIPVGRSFEQSPPPDPSTYRFLMAASASVLVIFLSVPAAAFAGTAAVLGLRRGTAPRWLGYVGVGLSVLMLLSAFVAPLMVFGLWLVVSGVALAVAQPSGGPGLLPEADRVAVAR